MGARRRIVLLCTALALLLTGCFGSGRVKTEITKFDGCEDPVSARFYLGGADGAYHVEELPSGKLEALVQALDGLRYTTHSCHTDYFWAGQYGVELTLADGTFWNYDGTRVEHRSVSITETRDEKTRIAGTFTDLQDCSFWECLEPFFDSAKQSQP